MNRTVIGASLLLGISAIGCKSEHASNEENPNVVVILADDMGYGDIKALNPSSKIPTPNLDRLVNEGVNFTDAHSNSAVCTPTRYGILTGRYSFRTRLKKGVLSGYDASLIEKDRSTLAHLFKAEQYHTACIGKWHLGLDWEKKDESDPLVSGGGKYNPANTDNVNYEGLVKGGPFDHGFDHEYILPASLDMPPYVFVQDQRVETQPIKSLEAYKDSLCRGILYRNGDAAPDFKHENVLQHITDKAKTYISEKADSKSPFFLYLPLTAPHTPWLPSAEFQNKSEAGVYGDFVCMVDDMLGQIEKMLKEKGLDENTIVVFTSDNGSHWKESEKQKYKHSANANRRGMKSDVYDGGHRVPFLVKWPEQVKGGECCDQLICTTDLFATCADILNVKTKESDGEDSQSFLPYLLHPEKEVSKRSIIHHSVNGSFAIRKGEWKLIDCAGSRGWSETSPMNAKMKLPIQLYNMNRDPNEEINLADKHPEIVEEMKNELYQIRGN